MKHLIVEQRYIIKAMIQQEYKQKRYSFGHRQDKWVGMSGIHYYRKGLVHAELEGSVSEWQGCCG